MTESMTRYARCAVFRIKGTSTGSALNQILINAGKDVKEIVGKFDKMGGNYGYDVKNEKTGDMYKMGVIDPLKVTKNALVNAVSVATTILSTNAIITHKRV